MEKRRVDAGSVPACVERTVEDAAWGEDGKLFFVCPIHGRELVGRVFCMDVEPVDRTTKPRSWSGLHGHSVLRKKWTGEAKEQAKEPDA